MNKYKKFACGEVGTDRQVCDGLLEHSWKVLSADSDADTHVFGLCWCETCGAIGRWNNLGPNSIESVTEMTLTENNPNAFS